MLLMTDFVLYDHNEPLSYVLDFEMKVRGDLANIEATTIRLIENKRVYEDWIVVDIDQRRLPRYKELEPMKVCRVYLKPIALEDKKYDIPQQL